MKGLHTYSFAGSLSRKGNNRRRPRLCEYINVRYVIYTYIVHRLIYGLCVGATVFPVPVICFRVSHSISIPRSRPPPRECNISLPRIGLVRVNYLNAVAWSACLLLLLLLYPYRPCTPCLYIIYGVIYLSVLFDYGFPRRERDFPRIIYLSHMFRIHLKHS